MINVETKKYSTLICIAQASKHLINYINADVIKYNTIDPLDLKYLKSRMDRLNDLISKTDNDEN